MTGLTCSDDDCGLILLSDERGAPVFDCANHRVAVLKFLICDPQTDQPRHAVLSCDGFLGPGEDCRPIPAILLVRAAETAGFTLNVDRRTFLKGPCHADKDGRDWNDWVNEVDGYYTEAVSQAAAAHRPRLISS